MHVALLLCAVAYFLGKVLSAPDCSPLSYVSKTRQSVRTKAKEQQDSVFDFSLSPQSYPMGHEESLH